MPRVAKKDLVTRLNRFAETAAAVRAAAAAAVIVDSRETRVVGHCGSGSQD